MKWVTLLLTLLMAPQVWAQTNYSNWRFGTEYYQYVEPAVMTEETRLPTLIVNYRRDAGANSAAIGLPITLDAEFGYGLTQYTGTGDMNTSFTRLKFEGVYLSDTGLFLGLGYRTLTDHLGYKLSSTGAAGYDRLSQYYYAPIGFVSETDGNRWQIQYNYFLRGTQTSYFTQISGYGNDVRNTQKRGFGIDLSYAPASAGWELFWRYWSLEDSDMQLLYSAGGDPLSFALEPKNTTSELGIRFSF